MSIVWQRFKEGTMLALRADRLPRTVWGSNLRAFFPASRWQELSRGTAERAGQECEVCGRVRDGRSGLDCHEMWEFLDSDGVRVQRLVGVIATCNWCHLTQHSGRADMIGRYDDVVAVLMGVNRWTQLRAVRDITASEMEFRERSRFDWALDLSVLAGWLELPDKASLLVPADCRELLGNADTNVVPEIRPVFDGDVPAGVWEWDDRLPLRPKDER
ncbi:hypothetical protein [Microbacterium oxydans]|uniref:HNH endonuclease n=1 Tax=Microbacterium oxydans TaxID=82380 RepID=A0A0F0LDB8_9MICO|nr:hypothetical protein [Microbacterium oxydans]KJL29556.1 hypothetical protein RS83_01573 [Microbacterium oxydans]